MKGKATVGTAFLYIKEVRKVLDLSVVFWCNATLISYPFIFRMQNDVKIMDVTKRRK